MRSPLPPAVTNTSPSGTTSDRKEVGSRFSSVHVTPPSVDRRNVACRVPTIQVAQMQTVTQLGALLLRLAHEVPVMQVGGQGVAAPDDHVLRLGETFWVDAGDRAMGEEPGRRGT